MDNKIQKTSSSYVYGSFSVLMTWLIANTEIVLAASTGEGPQNGGLLWNLVILVGFIAIVYFMLILPQKRQNQAHQSMLDNLQIGSEVVTNGGLIGKVVAIGEHDVWLSVGEQNIKVQVLKSLISDLYENILIRREEAIKNAQARLKAGVKAENKTEVKVQPLAARIAGAQRKVQAATSKTKGKQNTKMQK